MRQAAGPLRALLQRPAALRAAAPLAWRYAGTQLLPPRWSHGGAQRGRPWEHRAAVAAGTAWSGDTLTYTPIGVFEGPFRTRNGTPRQGVLAPRARGTVRLLGDALAHGAADALSGLDGYSHALLLFHFHANTPSRAASKVAPPRLGGARVGVFATRAPHRPNAIGLSVVRIEAVHGTCLHVSGADLLHNTPVLDIKPYVPSYDAHPEAHVPEWLSGAADTAPRTVRWSPAARAGLQAAAPALRFLRGAEDAAAAVEDALRSELRSAYRRRECAGEAYGFYIDVLDVRCVFDDVARVVDITDVALSPYDEQLSEEGDGNAEAVGVAPADAAAFRALLSPAGLATRVSDAGAALWRANGVLLGAPVGAQHAGAAATLRYDWRSAVLRVAVRDAHGDAAYALDAHAMRVSTARGFKPLRTLALWLLHGPAPGGAAGWLRPGAKLGVAALWDALAARPPLTPQQFEAWERGDASSQQQDDDADAEQEADGEH